MIGPEGKRDMSRGGSWKSAKRLFGAVLSGKTRQLLSERPKVVVDLLTRAGEQSLSAVSVRRTPIVSAVNWILTNTMSFGEAVKQLGYDKVFHLAVDFTTSTGERLSVEKNARIDVGYGAPAADAKSEMLALPVVNSKTIRQLFEESEARVGTARLYGYDARSTNCQLFVGDLLTTLGAFTPEASAFVMQDAAALLTKNEGKLARLVTDIGGIFDYAVKGGACEKCGCI